MQFVQSKMRNCAVQKHKVEDIIVQFSKSYCCAVQDAAPLGALPLTPVIGVRRDESTTSSSARHQKTPEVVRSHIVEDKKDGYRQRNVRQFLQSCSLMHIIWLPQESHAGMSLPSAVLREQTFGYVN